MESLRAGYERLRRRTERVGDKCDNFMKQALTSGSHVRQALVAVKHTIRGRTIVEEHQISEGGFAFVWAARDCQTNEEFALKKIICQDSEGLAMAKREVALCERLPQHPNIVKYYGHTVCDTDGRAKEVLLLFELCAGGHLLHLLERHNGLLEEKQIVKVLTDMAMAVAVLQMQSPPIQHRDLKVENVLLGADGCYKLCDFGSWSDECIIPANLDGKGAAALQEQIDKYTTMMYRPPEMVDFYLPFSISEKVDMWMLGCVLFTLMFYSHPFQDQSVLAISNARYMMPSTPEFSDKMLDLTHWLLARDPADRPTAIQLLDILQNFGSRDSLPMPKAVAEKKEHLHRLYDDFSPSSQAAARKPQKPAKQRHSSKRRRKVEQEALVPASFWAKADIPKVEVWHSLAVPEPSRAWATFGASDPFGTDAGKALTPPTLLPVSTMTLQAKATTPQGGTPRQQTPTSNTNGGSPAVTPQHYTNIWALSTATTPTATLQLPEPQSHSHSGGGGGGSLPLALSGHSTTSGKSNTSQRSHERSPVSWTSVSSHDRRSEGAPKREAGFVAASVTPPRSRAAQAPEGQGAVGDFWSLAGADNPSQPWDPFAQHVQWPSPPVAAGEAGERRLVTPPRLRCAQGATYTVQSPGAAPWQHGSEHTPPGSERYGGNKAADAWVPWVSEKGAMLHFASNTMLASTALRPSDAKPQHARAMLAPGDSVREAASPWSPAGMTEARHRRTKSAPQSQSDTPADPAEVDPLSGSAPASTSQDTPLLQDAAVWASPFPATDLGRQCC